MKLTRFRHISAAVLLGFLLAFFIIITLTTDSWTLSKSSTRRLLVSNNQAFESRLNNFADLFIRGSYDILHMIKIRELGKLGQACKIATKRKLAGGTIASKIGTPHITWAGECDSNRPGNPNIAPETIDFNRKHNPIIGLGEGDFIITAHPGNEVLEARKKGAFVLGVGYAMMTNRYSPPGYNDWPDRPIETCADIMFYTWGPFEDGLITPKLTPNLKICPTSPMAAVAYWLIMAQLAHNLAYKDISGTFKAAEAYLDSIMIRLDRFHQNHLADVNCAGEIIAEKVLSGGKIYPWSGRPEFWVEANGTAGGLMGVNKLDPDNIKVTDKDVLILACAEATPENEIEVAKKVKEKGAWIVGIYPSKRDDNFSMKPLRDICDMSLDNYSGDVQGIFDIPGYDEKIIPASGTMNNLIFWAIVAAYVQAMESRGEAPYYWMSYHVDGGAGHVYDDSIRPYFIKRGY